jgi:hypothetical protein
MTSFLTKKPDIETLRQQKNIPALIKALRYDDFECRRAAKPSVRGQELISFSSHEDKGQGCQAWYHRGVVGDTGSGRCHR